MRPHDHKPRAENSDPSGVAPAVDGLFYPVFCRKGLHDACAVHHACVLLIGDEIRVRPLVVQVLQVVLVLLSKGSGGFLVALAPSRHRQRAPRSKHPHHLFNILLLIRHVLPGLAGPHQVESVVCMLLVERVHHLELHIAQPLILSELSPALHLVGRERDPGNLGVGKLLGENARGPSDPAAAVQDALDILALGAAPLQHLVGEVFLGLDEVLLQVPCRPLLFCVVSQVDVFAPVVFQDTLLRPGIVLSRYSVAGSVGARGSVKDVFDTTSSNYSCSHPYSHRIFGYECLSTGERASVCGCCGADLINLVLLGEHSR
mmetsp:Transcript_16239/g.22445  ORF Transcript_16239/g.22445 Transcript_16239/m.22445 type:complete len:317 (-) Transcript_16239:322-1272(-)